MHGDFGPSFRYKDFTVTELIESGVPVSARLGASAIVISLILGITLGTFAALRQNQFGDHAAMGLAVAGIAIPNYVVAPILTLIFGIYLGVLPVGGWNDGALRNMILPVATLALPLVAYITRLTRGSMIEVLRSNYIRTARAKGLPMRIIIWRHALPAAILPVVTFLGPAAAGVLTGSLVVEQIFGLPGIGRYFVQGALNRDYTLGDGRGDSLCQPDHHPESGRRHRLRGARSQGALQMTAENRCTADVSAREGPQPVAGCAGAPVAQPRGDRGDGRSCSSSCASRSWCRCSASIRSTTSISRRSSCRRPSSIAISSARIRWAATCSCAPCSARGSRC